MFGFKSTIFKIAFSNLWRRKWRTMIVITMITVSLGLLIFISGLYDGWIDQWINDAIESDTGQIAVYEKGYRLSNKLSDRIRDPRKISKALAEVENVKAFVPRLKIDGMVSSARYSQGVQVIGIIPGEDDKVTNIERSLTQGVYKMQQGKREAIIGYQLAEKLRVKLKSKIVIMGQGEGKDIASGAFRIVGIVRCNNPAIDKYAVIVRLDDAQKMFKLGRGITQFSINVKNSELLDQTDKEIQKKIGGKYEVFTWKEMFKAFEWMLDMMKNFKKISFIIVFIIVAIGIFNIVLISIMERVREFGIMMALGTKFFQIAGIVIWESMLMGTMGLISGCFFGFLILLFFKTFGLNMGAFSAGLSEFGFAAVIHPVIKLEYFTMSATAVFITSFLASLWPIRILKKLKPIQAIHFM
ncbi:ABC transporter permease [Candidatus Margulisiibacteriota bacterium]